MPPPPPDAATPALIWLRAAPPARRLLSRESIVQAGIRVADAGGSSALTMSAVAAELGSYTAMALYRYVDSKDGLVDLMLDAVVAEIPIPDPDETDWRAVIRRLEQDSWTMTGRHPWYAQLVHTRPPLGPNTMRRTEAALTVLTSAGLDLTDALGYLALLDRHVFANAVMAAEEQAMARFYGIEDEHDLADAIRALVDVGDVADGSAYPLLSQWMRNPAGLSPEQQMTVGLNFLLEGIARRIDGSATS